MSVEYSILRQKLSILYLCSENSNIICEYLYKISTPFIDYISSHRKKKIFFWIKGGKYFENISTRMSQP